MIGKVFLFLFILEHLPKFLCRLPVVAVTVVAEAISDKERIKSKKY